MSTLWTPSGEHPVGRPGQAPGGNGPGGGTGGGASGGGQPPGQQGTGRPPGARQSPAPGPAPGAAGPPERGVAGTGDAGPEAEAHLAELQRQLASTPASDVVANHCYGLFELAAVYLSQSPPRFDEARLAVDALGFIVDGLGPRLQQSQGTLEDALAQIRLAFAQLKAAEDARTTQQPAANGAATGPPPAPQASS